MGVKEGGNLVATFKMVIWIDLKLKHVRLMLRASIENIEELKNIHIA